ncbi:MAG: tRNA lysidine(34) synthetase TilS [Planctomycetales bacterium]|nr:tRNA lysidine(34) synthetase TilS [Planctomycetales bacterium]
MRSPDLLPQVSLAARGVVADGDRVVVACSGGGDSVALLHLLRELPAAGGPRLGLVVATLDHGIRGEESAADAAFVEALAARLGLPCRRGRADVPGLLARDGGSLEDLARRERYRFLGEVAREAGSSAIALAHTRDDQAETMLLRLARGAGPRGLGGMRALRPLAPGSPIRIWRPLLGVCRDDLRAALHERGESWREDATNEDRHRARARVRHEALPALEAALGPGFAARLADAASSFAALADLLDAAAAPLAEACVRPAPQGALVLREPLLGLPSSLLAPVLAAAFARAGGDPGRLGRGHYDRLADLLGGRGVATTLPGAIEARATAEGLRLDDSPRRVAESPPCPEPAEGSRRVECTVPVPGSVETWPGGGTLRTAELVPGGRAPLDLLGPAGPDRAAVLDCEAIALPLRARPRRAGDRFRPLGAPGRRLLSDVLVDRKVPRDVRDILPVLEDASGRILWVPGSPPADEARLTPTTREVLRVEWIPTGPGESPSRSAP